MAWCADPEGANNPNRIFNSFLQNSEGVLDWRGDTNRMGCLDLRRVEVAVEGDCSMFLRLRITVQHLYSDHWHCKVLRGLW